MTPTRRGPLLLGSLASPAFPARLGTLAAGLAAATLALAGCTAVPESVDEIARKYGVELDTGGTEITSLAVGDCFNGFEGEGRTVGTVDCTEEHDSELIHVHTVDSSVDSYPGDPEEAHLWQDHDVACYGKAFEDYVGEPYETSSWDVVTYVPTEWSWAGGDRTIQCVVYSLEGQYWTGSPSAGDAVVTPLLGPDGEPIDVYGDEDETEAGDETGDGAGPDHVES